MAFTIVIMHHDVIPDRRARTDKRRADRVEGILDTAMNILATEGEGALTMGRLAKDEGLVAAALYRYFPSKDAILVALQKRALLDLSSRLKLERARWEERLARHEKPVRALGALIAAGRFYLGLRDAAPETWSLIALLLGDPRPLLSAPDAAANAPLATALLGELSSLLNDGVRADALSPGDSFNRAIVMWASLQGLGQLEKLRRVAPLPENALLSELTIKTILLGFGAESSLYSKSRSAL
ncbi:MAG: TetR/AcrR family transcriptional regulator [Polyangiaceae bacterium]|nr:TetR/AcrR family transcriptional regulator [Polyangiaceae bacterium]